MMRRAWSQIRKTELFNEHGERGAVLIITAILLVVLIGFAALAVDLGALFVERRHAQTAADVGVLSGAQFATDPDGDVARQQVINETKDISATNLAGNDWLNCVDPNMPGEFSPLAGETPCISFTLGLKKIRVRVPDQSFNTFFAGVFGISTLDTSAAAEVEGQYHRNGDILPFGIPTGDHTATLGCPSDHPNGLFPCDGPSAGNFNRLQITQWGLEPPPDHQCPHTNGVFEDNIAEGVDHILGVWPEDPGFDPDMCDNPVFGSRPGIVQSNTGVAQSTLAPGLITGNTGESAFTGRLTSSVFGTPVNVLSHPVDNKPLWEFIGNANVGVPASCRGTSFTSGGPEDWDEDLWVSLAYDPLLDDPDYDGDPNGTSHLEPAASFEHMARCLREYEKGEWDAGTGYPDYVGAGYDITSKGTAVLFDKEDRVTTAETEFGIYDLQLSPRWGWSPWGEYTTGVAPFKIRGYVPIYINTLVANCTANTCNWDWHAGQTPTSGTTQGNKIESMISFQIPIAALPSTVEEFGPGARLEPEYTLTK